MILLIVGHQDMFLDMTSYPVDSQCKGVLKKLPREKFGTGD